MISITFLPLEVSVLMTCGSTLVFLIVSIFSIALVFSIIMVIYEKDIYDKYLSQSIVKRAEY